MAWLAPIAAVGLSKALEKKDPSEDIYKDQAARLAMVGLPGLEAFQYVPEDYQYSTVTEDPTVGLRQMALLDRLQSLGETGLSEADKASYEMATNQANQAARQRSEALMNEARSRGQGGSGLEYALREQAGQEAMSRAQQAGLQQAGDSARQRALYQRAYGQALGQKRQQDYTTQANNTDIINRFNQLNTGARNDANLANMQRINDVRQQNYQNAMGKATGQMASSAAIANASANQAAANNALIRGGLGEAANAYMGSQGYGPYAQKQKKQEE